MADDDYEILPHAELDYLRKEVERLKKNPYGDTESGETLLDAMNNLTGSINRLLSILETANEEMIQDYEGSKTSHRMDRLIEQNEKLAVGIVAIGELVKDVLKRGEKSEEPVRDELSGQDAPFEEPIQNSQPTPKEGEIPSLAGLPPPPRDTPTNLAPLDDAPLPPQ